MTDRVAYIYGSLEIQLEVLNAEMGVGLNKSFLHFLPTLLDIELYLVPEPSLLLQHLLAVGTRQRSTRRDAADHISFVSYSKSHLQ